MHCEKCHAEMDQATARFQKTCHNCKGEPVRRIESSLNTLDKLDEAARHARKLCHN